MKSRRWALIRFAQWRPRHRTHQMTPKILIAVIDIVTGMLAGSLENQRDMLRHKVRGTGRIGRRRFKLTCCVLGVGRALDRASSSWPT